MDMLWLNALVPHRRDMPAVFYRLYPVPEEMRGDNHWFKTITYVSHPFDPLLTVSACFPNFFLLEPVKNKTGKGDHQIIGRIADDGICGVPDPDKAREELNRVIRKAGERIRHVIAPEPVPFLLVTDIGRHVDDTLALLTVAQYQKEGLIRLAGVVTTGGEAKKRARLARFWLRRLGMRDSDVHVAACEGDVEDTDEPDVCELPETDPPIPEFHDAAIYQGTSKERSAAELILNLAELYNGKLHVFAMAPLTAVASALEFEVDVETMRKGLGKLWIQGQAYVNAGVLSPNFEAFNLRQDQKASVEVFEKLQNHVPFEMLSKHAAHRIEFTKEDFDKWDEAAGDHILLDQAISGLKGLRTYTSLPPRLPSRNPVIFGKKLISGLRAFPGLLCLSLISRPQEQARGFQPAVSFLRRQGRRRVDGRPYLHQPPVPVAPGSRRIPSRPLQPRKDRLQKGTKPAPLHHREGARG